VAGGISTHLAKGKHRDQLAKLANQSKRKSMIPDKDRGGKANGPKCSIFRSRTG